jgi:AcrR family transcriptional regulator
MSRSSFFRYFPTKEDVVLGSVTDHGRQILAALVERPDDEPIWTAVRAAFEPVVADRPAEDLDRSLRTARMFMQTPTLQARHYEKILVWQSLLAPEVARRLGITDHAGDPRPAALIASATACLDTALRVWTATDGRTSLAELFDQAISVIGSRAT